MQNNEEGPITEWWGSLILFIYIYILYMQWIPVDYLGAPSAAHQETPSPNLGESREVRDQVCMLIVSPQNLTCNSAELLSQYLPIPGKNLKPEYHGPDTLQNPMGGQPLHPAKESADVIGDEMSAKANLLLVQTPTPNMQYISHEIYSFIVCALSCYILSS